MKQTFFSAIILLVLAGCASQPVAFNQDKDQGQWEAKAQLRDLEKGSSNNLSLEVIAQRDRALRMEVNGTMGVHVASLLLKGPDVSYAVHTQKRFFSGPASEKSLKPLLKAEIDPRWLYGVFFDEPLQGWDCLGEPVEKCERTDGTQVVWSDRDGEKKRITISNSQYQLQVLVKNFTTKVQSPDKSFQLESPESYKRYKLQ